MKTLFPSDEESLQPPPADASPSAEQAAWRKIRQELERVLETEPFTSWIAPIKVGPTQKPNELMLLTPGMVFYRRFLTDYLHLVEECKDKVGLEGLIIKIDIESLGAIDREPLLGEQGGRPPLELEKSAPQPPMATEAAPAATAQDAQEKASPFSSTLSRTPKLNSNYTFSSFVRGPSNQFALATCQNVAENPGLNYNPLFLYGSTGLGKTHLLHAVGNKVLQLNPNLIVTYISSERFMNEMIYCIRHNKMWDFRQKYRHCDVFMMDDIQFISGNKAATQEEFFHTFNTLYEAKKQIIVTSDLFPQDIPDIEERLRNRFQWGLIADIQPPDIEHRIAILYSKAEKLGVALNSEVAEYIADHAKRNVRELEGALHRIAAFAALHGRALDKSLAMETFRSTLTETSKPMMVEIVQKTVAEHFKLKVADLKSKKRQRALTLPRQIAMYLTRNFTNASYPEIGEKFGGKDHTTIIHAVKKIGLEKERDLDVRAHIESLERALEQVQ